MCVCVRVCVCGCVCVCGVCVLVVVVGGVEDGEVEREWEGWGRGVTVATLWEVRCVDAGGGGGIE